VAALEPRNYVGDNGARVTAVLPVTHYNIACCYGALGQVEEGLRSLETAFSLGFEVCVRVRVCVLGRGGWVHGLGMVGLGMVVEGALVGSGQRAVCQQVSAPPAHLLLCKQHRSGEPPLPTK